MNCALCRYNSYVLERVLNLMIAIAAVLVFNVLVFPSLAATQMKKVAEKLYADLALTYG